MFKVDFNNEVKLLSVYFPHISVLYMVLEEDIASEPIFNRLLLAARWSKLPLRFWMGPAWAQKASKCRLVTATSRGHLGWGVCEQVHERDWTLHLEFEKWYLKYLRLVTVDNAAFSHQSMQSTDVLRTTGWKLRNKECSAHCVCRLQ